MAIGPEQLDIKALAKLFLLKSQLGATLTKEDLREILLTFNEEDFDGIRDMINPASAEKKALREMIKEAAEFLNSMKVGNNIGEYSQSSYDILDEAINLAAAIARSTYDGAGEEGVLGRGILVDTTAALMNIKERTFSSVLCEKGGEFVVSTINDEGSIENVIKWYGPHNYYGGKPWVPVKTLSFQYTDDITRVTSTIRCYVTPNLTDAMYLPSDYCTGIPIINESDTDEQKEAKQECNRIIGLYLHDEAAGKNVIITRQSSVSFLNSNGRKITKPISDLGGDFSDIQIIDGAIIGDILYCANEDVRYASLAASYLERPINAAPCMFFANNVGIRYEHRFQKMFAQISSGSTLTAEAKKILNIIPVAGSDEIVSLLSSSNAYATATAVPSQVDGRIIYVDNLHKVITGIGSLTVDQMRKQLMPNDNNSNIVLYSQTAHVSLHPTIIVNSLPKTLTNDEINKNDYADVSIVELKVQVTSADGNTINIFDVDLSNDILLVDQQADTINKYKYGEYDEQGRPVIDKIVYISKYRPVNKKYDWVPATMIGKYYISPEPINSELRLYKDNPDVVQIVGIVYNNKIYSRHPIPTVLTGKLPDPSINEPGQGQYRLSLIDCGYYDGYLFSGNSEHRNELAPYLNDLSVIRNGGGNNGHLGHVQSEFPKLVINNVETGDYYWKGTETDYKLLPDTRSDLKTYLNAVAFQTIPSGSQN